MKNAHAHQREYVLLQSSRFQPHDGVHKYGAAPGE